MLSRHLSRCVPSRSTPGRPKTLGSRDNWLLRICWNYSPYHACREGQPGGGAGKGRHSRGKGETILAEGGCPVSVARVTRLWMVRLGCTLTSTLEGISVQLFKASIRP